MNPPSEAAVLMPRPKPLERFLRLFADVQAGEGAKALLLMTTVFLILTGYSLIKPVREALIITAGGAELKTYLSGVMALLLLLVVPAYGALASRVNRIRLITTVILIFVSNLVAFFALRGLNALYYAVAFYIWIGIFNVCVVAQFWSFANDVYDPAQGKRLFAIVGVGSTVGAIAGAAIAKLMGKRLGPYVPMLLCAGVLLVCLVLFHVIHALDRREPRDRVRASQAAADQPLGGAGALKLLMDNRYLLLIGLLVLLANWVNTNGEYIISKTFKVMADRMVAAGQTGGLPAEAFQKQLALEFFAGYQLAVNILTATLQLFVVSRIFKWFGVRVALFVLPLIAMFGYGMMAWVPLLAYIRVAKIAENGCDYSIQNTARHALWLPTTREEKYKAKAAMDTFPQRMGDVLSACVVWLAARLVLPVRDMAVLNLALVVLWLLVVVGIARHHRRLVAEEGRV